MAGTWSLRDSRAPTPELEEAWAARLVAQLDRGCRKAQHALQRLAGLWSPPALPGLKLRRHLHQVRPSERDVEVVVRYTRDGRLPIRLAALQALGWALRHERARRALLAALEQEDLVLRRSALHGLLRIRTEPAVVTALRRALTDPAYVQRWDAAQALAGTDYRDEARAALLASPPRGVPYRDAWLQACSAFGKETHEEARKLVIPP